MAHAFFKDSRGEFMAFDTGSVTHYHPDGGQRTEFPGVAVTDRLFALKTVDMTEEQRGTHARAIIRGDE